MIKAAASSLFCLTLLAAVPVGTVRAQDSADVTRAAEEAVRRQADTKTLQEKLVAAEQAAARKDYQKAAKLFQDCQTLVQNIGREPIPDLAERTKVGLTAVMFELGAQYQAQQHYDQAESCYSRILVIDPTNQQAAIRKQENHRLWEDQQGKIPSQEVLDQVPGFHSNEVRIATMVQDGKLLFEAGKLDDAEVKLNQAYHEDPQNVAAHYYLELIAEKRNADATRRADLQSRQGLLQVEKSWDVPLRGERKAVPNIFARTNLVYTSKGRQNILSKLDRIRFDSVKYDGLDLAHVVETLADLARQRDPDKTGINFFLSHETPPTAAAAPGAVDPTTGLPVAPLPTEAVDVGSVTVKINPALNDIRLADVLDAITKTADKPIKYSIEDYAVVFSLKQPETVQMYTRTFRVDPNTFKQGLEGVGAIIFADIQLQNGSGGGGGGGGQSGQNGGGNTIIPRVNVAGGAAAGGGGGRGGGGNIGGGGGNANGLRMITVSNDTDQVQVLARNFFIAAGVDLNPANPANLGKTIFFNDRKGALMVHSTLADLDLIAQAIETLNQSPPEINIKAKFVELTQNDSRALGFDWFLGNVMLGGGKIAASGGTQPSYTAPATAANPATYLNGQSFFPGTIIPGTTDGLVAPANTTLPPSPTDGQITKGLRNTLGAPAIATITGVLTDPQFRVAIRALEQRDGVDLMTAPEVTTESGRQAQMQAVDIQAIVTGNGFNNSGAGTGGATTPIGGVTTFTQPIQIQPTTELLPFGPVLDVIPYVSADEYSIQMTIIPTVTEFIGYDDPGPFVLTAQSAAANATPVTAQLPLPHFRLRQVITSAIVWDAQTIVLGGLITDSVTKVKDKVPLLGDMPLVGRLFRSESETKTKKNLLIFVTPTIINPDGTRFHSDDEMPFAQNSIPPQANFKPATQP